MYPFVLAALSAFGVVFIAELGDKTQLIALGFGARYSLRTVVLGLTFGYAAAGAVAAAVGGILGATLPERPVALVSGILFLIFAVTTLLDDDVPDDDNTRPALRTRNVIASIALTIAVAEMGDKTQLATATLAARGNPVGTWLGATGGEVAAGMIGAVAGQRIGARLDARKLRIASAALFAVFGVALVVTAW